MKDSENNLRLDEDDRSAQTRWDLKVDAYHISFNKATVQVQGFHINNMCQITCQWLYKKWKNDNHDFEIFVPPEGPFIISL